MRGEHDSLLPEVIHKMKIEKYASEFKRCVKKNRVLVVDGPEPCESQVREWFEHNYAKLGYERVITECCCTKPTCEYRQLQLKIALHEPGYQSRPDYFVLERGAQQWKVLEAEDFSGTYLGHRNGYADIVLCWEDNRKLTGVKVIELVKVLGYKEVIAKKEAVDWFYDHSPKFRRNYEREFVEVQRSWFKNPDTTELSQRTKFILESQLPITPHIGDVNW